MSFVKCTLQKSAMLTSLWALGLSADPLDVTARETSTLQQMFGSWPERPDANGTWAANIDGVPFETNKAYAEEWVDSEGGKDHNFYAGRDPKLRVSMSIVFRSMDTAEKVVDGRYYFDDRVTARYAEAVRQFGGVLISIFPVTSGHVDLKFSPDRRWVEGRFTFTVERSDLGKRSVESGTFSMPSTDLGL